jgi:lauroyl/myristoyl acyltransferase
LCLRGHRERAVDNVLAFFPGSDRAWAAGVTLRSMEGLGSALAEAAGLAKQGREKLLAGTAAIGAENLEEALGVGSGVVVASAHMGCWELLPAYLAARGRRVAVLARPQAGRRESKLLREERGRLGVEEIGLGVAPLKRAVRILKAGGIVVCPFDRGRAMREDREGARQGLSAPALGVKLSATTGSVILPARALVSAGRHALVFEKPMMVGPRSDLEAAVRELESAVAKWVRQTPDQWVWLDGGRTQSAEV